MKKRIFILGASDPEMAAIEEVAKVNGVHVLYAAADGKRVHPGNAYRATGVEGEPWPPSSEGFALALIECAPADPESLGQAKPVAIDHHRPGDPGFGRPPAEYWEASSLGQVYDLLGLEPTPEARLVAAADHCLGAAYRSQCPGVDPTALRTWREKSRAAFQGIPEAEIRRKVDAALDALTGLPEVTLRGATFRDARGREIPELPEASAIAGQPVLYSLEDKRAGRIKVGVLNGAPAETQAFLDAVEELGLVDPYGDPARGFAGAYEG